MLSVYAKEIGDWIENVNSNVIELDGFICKPVIYRGTPFGREISDVLLAVNRNYNKSDYIPCIAWGTNAQIAKTLQVPTRIKIIGRIQSRPYNKKENDVNLADKTLTELKAMAKENNIKGYSTMKKEELLSNLK